MMPNRAVTAYEIWRRYDRMEARLTRPVSERMVELAKLQPGMRVLDVATGRGEPAILAAQRVAPNGSVLGVDLSAELLEMARERATSEGVTNLELRVTDAEALEGVPAGSFDRTLARWGLMYMAAPTLALAAARRAMVPGGILVAAVWAEPERVPYYTLPRRVLERYRPSTPIDFAAPGTFRYAHPERLRGDLSTAGFTIEHVEELDVDVMEADTDAELVAWVRAFGLGRLVDGLPEETQAAWERDLVEATDPLRRDGLVRLGGVTRILADQDVPWISPAAGDYALTTTGAGGAATGVLAGAAGRIDLFPFIPRDDITIDRLSVNVTMLIAAALGKIVLYAADATGRPATLILETSDLDFSTVGLKEATFSAKQTLSNANNDLGTSTGSGTTNLASGATLSANTKTVNIGTAGVAGSTTNVTIGSAVAGALGNLTINSPTVTFGSSVSAIAVAAANVSALYLGLGGATADATNRLSINAPASLFNHAGAGHQVKVNKAAGTDTGSFLFQTGFSGRAEFGLTGSDDFQIKVSGDGATWFNALAIEAASGRTTINALALANVGSDPVLPPNGACWYNSASGKFRGRQAGVSVDLVGGAAAIAAYGVLQANYTLTSATTAQKLFNWSTNGALSLAAGTYRFSCSLLLTSMSATSGSAKFDLKGAGSAIFGKMSMQDFGSRGTVAVGGTTATSGTASDVPASGGVLATAATSAALRASIHGTFEISTAGTIIPSIALDVAAAAVVNAGSYFECIYIGPAAALGGSWS